MSDAPGRIASGLDGRYRVEGELGRGGMATVFLAQDLKHQRPVAVKVILPERVSVVGLERFLREIGIAAKLRHPNILPLLDSGETDGLPYYVMPLVEGESLGARLSREKQLPIDEALRITCEVVDALAYAHAQGVIHRDIKPSNIMLDSGHAVVTDFGIALLALDDATERLTVSGFSPGSPEYASPEQVSGDHDVDERSDIYSLGCVLYEMLAGDPPFTGSIPQAILAKKLLEPVPSLRVVRDAVPDFVERALTVALARSPADRFGTAKAFGEALGGGRASRSAAGVGSLPVGASSPGGLAGLVAAVVAGVGALLTTIGFLTTRVFDLKLRIPTGYTPSRTDFPIIGAQALVPALFTLFAAAMAYIVLRLIWRGAAAGLRRVPGVGRRLGSLRHGSAEVWHRVWRAAEPATVADAYLLASLMVGGVVLAGFRPLIGALWSTDSAPLTCSYRTLHLTYSITMTLLTAGLALAWYKLTGYLRRRRAAGARVAAAKWGGLAWVVILVIVMTLPWRLLWDAEYPRALLDGEPAYILMEAEPGLLVYTPRTQSTERIGGNGDAQVERLGTLGYLFEDSVSFHGPRSGC